MDMVSKPGVAEGTSSKKGRGAEVVGTNTQYRQIYSEMCVGGASVFSKAPTSVLRVGKGSFMRCNAEAVTHIHLAAEPSCRVKSSVGQTGTDTSTYTRRLAERRCEWHAHLLLHLSSHMLLQSERLSHKLRQIKRGHGLPT